MNHQTVKLAVFAACMAVLGGLVAMEISEGFSVWAMLLGGCVGGVAGFFLWDWRVVVRSANVAYRTVRGLERPQDFWSMWFYTTFALFSIPLWSCLMPLVLVLVSMPSLDTLAGWHQAHLAVYCLLILLALSTSVLGVIALTLAVRDEFGRPRSLRNVKDVKEQIWLFSPPFVLLWHLPRWLWKNVGHMISAIGRFTILFIKLLLSRNRLIGAAGAMMGAMIGYLFGHLLICAAVGAGVAILLRELVAKRYLGVTPE